MQRSLRELGVEIEYNREGGTGRRNMTITNHNYIVEEEAPT